MVSIKAPAHNAGTPDADNIVRTFERLPFAAQTAVLQALRDCYRRRVAERRRELQAELDSLAEIEKGKPASGLKGKKAAIKYRSKQNPAHTWSGRGEKPRWLRDEMTAAGKPLEFYRTD